MIMKQAKRWKARKGSFKDKMISFHIIQFSNNNRLNSKSLDNQFRILAGEQLE